MQGATRLAAADYRISRITAEFLQSPVELAFREATYPARVRETRIAISIAALFYLAFAVTDYLAVGRGDQYTLIFVTRLGVCAVGMLVAFSAGRFWRALMDGVTPTLVEGMALAGFLSITLLRPYEAGWHGMSLMVMLLGVYVFIPNRFLPAAALALLSTAAFVWLLNEHFQPPENQLLTLFLLLLALNLFGMLSAHRISRLTREEYRDAEILRQANERLSLEIDARQRLEGELRALADEDPLTGIANRRHFTDAAEQGFAAARANGTPLSLLVLDIDYFKQINDTYGHLGGEEVLKALVAACRETLGGVERLARLGGAEFVLLLPGSDIAAAGALAGRLGAATRQTPVRLPTGSVHFTVSIGIAQWLPDESLTVFMRRADEALQRARFNGRDRAELAAGEIRPGPLERGPRGGENADSAHPAERP
jgi:diguanylate cyclase